jgi:hypothetical protein
VNAGRRGAYRRSCSRNKRSNRRQHLRAPGTRGSAITRSVRGGQGSMAHGQTSLAKDTYRPLAGSTRASNALSVFCEHPAIHCPIAYTDLLPANTAANANPSTVGSPCRTPRASRGSGTPDRALTRPSCPLRPNTTGCVELPDWPWTALISNDAGAGTVTPYSDLKASRTSRSPEPCPPRQIHSGHQHRVSDRALSDLAVPVIGGAGR